MFLIFLVIVQTGVELIEFLKEVKQVVVQQFNFKFKLKKLILLF